MKIRIALVLCCVLFSCQEKVKENSSNSFEKSDGIVIVDFDQMENYINVHSSKTLVVNFWATWCKPCVKELPAFEKLGASYNSNDLSVILVSLDFPEQLGQLKKFIKDRELKSEVLFLNDDNANEWIPKVSDKWSGAIPATLIVSNKTKNFYERSFTYAELEKEIIPHLNKEL